MADAPRRALFLARAGLVLSLLFSSLTAFAETDANTENQPKDELAQYSPEVRHKATLIARQVMSPFCPGRTISDCTSEYAAEWRREIAQMLAAGKSPVEIQAEFEARAGRDLSGSPNRSVGYVFPVVVGVSAAALLLLVLSRLRQPSVKEKAAPDDAKSIDDERLRAELKALDEEP